ncbi:hypothetical protein DC20_01190 [Rufibacter tibetensis]|uniref:Uncharacterized protein n=1 Tax=Rufibacter tibetensis TaxID=512763 RepID=A0A0P0CFS1_9BACT|nr:hypothetical protein DC20_01190 [Rufibacter tibetensis]
MLPQSTLSKLLKLLPKAIGWFWQMHPVLSGPARFSKNHPINRKGKQELDFLFPFRMKLIVRKLTLSDTL